MWFKKKKEITEVEDKEKIEFEKIEFEKMLAKFPQGVYSFLGQDVYLFEYSNPNDEGYHYLPNFRIEWFDNNKNLCTALISHANPFLIRKAD